jgi:hypothetical protein
MPKGVYPRQLCRICNHPEKGRMELALASGKTLKSVYLAFGVSKDSLARHWRVCVNTKHRAELLTRPIEIGQLAELAAAENRSLLEYLGILRSALFRMFEEAREEKRRYDASVISSKLLAVLECIGKITGELRTGAGITINTQVNGAAPAALNDAELAKVQALIIRTLRPYPEARAAVVMALEGATSGPVFPDHQPPLQIEGTANG